jgi:hypothetical protein
MLRAPGWWRPGGGRTYRKAEWEDPAAGHGREGMQAAG